MLRDINLPSSLLVSSNIHVPSPPLPLSIFLCSCSRKLHRAQKIFILRRFRVLSEPQLMNTPAIKNWWSKAGRSVERIPDILDNVTVRSGVYTRVHVSCRLYSVYTRVQGVHFRISTYLENKAFCMWIQKLKKFRLSFIQSFKHSSSFQL